MLQREGLAVDGSWRVNVNSTRCCAFFMELGINNSRKSRDGSAAYNIRLLGIAVLRGDPRPAAFSNIVRVREAGRRMKMVELLVERSDSPTCRRSIKAKARTPFAGTSIAGWAMGIAAGFLQSACRWTKVYDDMLENEVNFHRRCQLAREQKEAAVIEARRADVVLRWLLGERITAADPDFETFNRLILVPLEQSIVEQRARRHIRVALPPRVDGVGVADARVGGDPPVGMNADL